jgi:hypothetical protein
VTAAAREEAWKEVLEAAGDRQVVEVHHPLPLGDRDIFRVPVEHRTDIVDDDVYRPKVRFGLSGNGGDRCFGEHVGMASDGLSAGFDNGSRREPRGLDIDVSDRKPRPALCEFVRRRLADPLGTAEDQGRGAAKDVRIGHIRSVPGFAPGFAARVRAYSTTTRTRARFWMRA